MLLFLLHLSLGSLMEVCFLLGRDMDIYSNRDSASKPLSRNKEKYAKEEEAKDKRERGRVQKCQRQVIIDIIRISCNEVYNLE